MKFFRSDLLLNEGVMDKWLMPSRSEIAGVCDQAGGKAVPTDWTILVGYQYKKNYIEQNVHFGANKQVGADTGVCPYSLS